MIGLKKVLCLKI